MSSLENAFAQQSSPNMTRPSW